MSKNKNKNKASNQTVSVALESAIETANVSVPDSSVAVLDVPVTGAKDESGAIVMDGPVIRPLARIADCFSIDGERLSLRKDVTAPSDEEFALFIADRLQTANVATSHSAYALYEASKCGSLVYNSVITRLGLQGVSASALSNLKNVALRVVPLQIEQGYTAPLSLLKDAKAAIIDNEGKTKTTAESIELQRMFKTGLNPEGTTVQTAKGPKDVSGQPITTVSIRAVRDKYDKDGALKAPPVVSSPTPAQTTEVRSASASNATGEPATAESEEEAKASAIPAPTVLVDESKPDSAGSVPATVGVPAPKSGAMTEGELIVAAMEAGVRRMEAFVANHSFKSDERAALLIVAGKLAKQFGASIVGV